MALRGPGRRKIYKGRRRLGIYLSADEYERLSWLSTDSRVSMTQIVRHALLRYFKETQDGK